MESAASLGPFGPSNTIRTVFVSTRRRIPIFLGLRIPPCSVMCSVNQSCGAPWMTPLALHGSFTLLEVIEYMLCSSVICQGYKLAFGRFAVRAGG